MNKPEQVINEVPTCECVDCVVGMHEWVTSEGHFVVGVQESVTCMSSEGSCHLKHVTSCEAAENEPVDDALEVECELPIWKSSLSAGNAPLTHDSVDDNPVSLFDHDSSHMESMGVAASHTEEHGAQLQIKAVG